ncbi:hypothetical protein ARMSODRAFT_962612 [Armillaria solidipes]|uniref:Uncharacterized protein n=1 Tax=Armillaria solidipes TaxID=1076256 RepID=A0A2H3BCW0_9AGAR|nr:hypothetical protein ARMSODRAFT_962612 [Armillaria solidipes]
MHSLPFRLRCSLIRAPCGIWPRSTASRIPSRAKSLEWQTELMTKYPSLFAGSEMQKRGLECGRGRKELIRQICDELKGKDVAFTQIKEKFGKLRIYVGKADRETRRYLEDMEEKSGKVCEKCGRTGDLAVSNGWLFATCEECVKESGREFRWLEDVQKEQSLEEDRT